MATGARSAAVEPTLSSHLELSPKWRNTSQSLHTNSYYIAVNNILLAAVTREEVLAALDRIRALLQNEWSPR